MDVKLFSLCKQELPEAQTGKAMILECVKSFFPECEDFTAFASQKRMLLAVSQSLRAADVVIVAVQGNMYNATKRLLTAALDMKTAKKAEVATVIKPLLDNGRIKQNVYEANIRFPHESVIMPTKSYLHCGFILSAGGQHIIYVPVESPRADEVVLGALYDCLAEICEEDCSSAIENRHKRLIERAAEKLDDASSTATFSGEAITSHLEKYASDRTLRRCMFVDETKHYSDINKEDLIEKARGLRKYRSSDLGVVMTDMATDDNGERSVTVAIADESGTSTLEIFAEKNETDEQFISSCVDKTIFTLCDFEELSSAGKEEEITTKADKKLRSYLFRIASGAVGASAVVGIIIALIMK